MSSRKEAAFGAMRNAIASVPKPNRSIFRRGDASTNDEYKLTSPNVSERQVKFLSKDRVSDDDDDNDDDDDDNDNSNDNENNSDNHYVAHRRRDDQAKNSDDSSHKSSDDRNGKLKRIIVHGRNSARASESLRRRNVSNRLSKRHLIDGESTSAASEEGKVDDMNDEGRGSIKAIKTAETVVDRYREGSGPKSGRAQRARANASARASGSSSAPSYTLRSHGMRGEPDETGTTVPRLRTPADGIPEVHFLGELVGVKRVHLRDGGGGGCPGTEQTCYYSCRWSIEYGKSWSHLEGECSGQSQYCFYSRNGVGWSVGGGGECIWDHPLDVHFATASVRGWPRIMLQIWALDEYGRANISGYGFTHLPTTPGQHNLTIMCWRPMGSALDEMQAFFLGSMPQLKDDDCIFGKAWQDRYRFSTVPAGEVQINICVIERHFAVQSIDGV